MGTFAGLLTRCINDEGYIEKASDKDLDSKTGNRGTANYTKFSRDVNAAGLMGCQGQPWCGTCQFAEDLNEFGKDNALAKWYMTDKTYVGYNCFATYNTFKKVGKVGMTPKVGALVIFNYSHMGRVLSIYSEKGIKYYDCFEGNTLPDVESRNGGQCAIKRRRYDDLSVVKGYCYIDYNDATDDNEPQEAGWRKEDGGWRFYLGDAEGHATSCITNDWYLDGNKEWAWFDGAGFAIHDTWYKYKGLWYYFGSDCYMEHEKWIEYKGDQYYLTADGSMATNAYVQSKDPMTTSIWYYVDAEGKWDPNKTVHGDLQVGAKVVI